MSVLLLIFGLLCFIALVVVHEFGHFIMARRGGIEVEEFGIGFPPRAKVLTKKNGTTYTLNWLPLGGFVKLKGENDADTEPGTFGAAPLGTKVKVMLAGVVMNLLAAFAILTFLALVGMPKLIDNQFTVPSDTKIVRQDVLVNYVESNSPAEKAGLKVEDKLLNISYNDRKSIVGIVSSDKLPALTKRFQGKSVDIAVKRDGQVKYLPVKLRSAAEVAKSAKTDHPEGVLGISTQEFVVQRSTWSAPIVAVGFMKQATELTFKGLGAVVADLFRGDTAEASSQVSGPIGIIFILKIASTLGYQSILMIIAIISLTLAIMNVLPIPALDGGRLFVTLLFRAIRKPLKQRTEDLIHGTGFMVLMFIFVLITIVDVRRFF